MKYYREALEIDKLIFGDKHTNVATRLSNIGTALHYQGKYDEALNYFFQALEIDKNIYGDTHINTAISYNNIALLYFDINRTNEGLPYICKAYLIFLITYGNDNPRIQDIKSNLISMGGDPIPIEKEAAEIIKKKAEENKN